VKLGHNLRRVPRPHWHLRLRIVRDLPADVEGFNTTRFQLGGVYDVNAPLCDLLIASGYAVPVAGILPPDDEAPSELPEAEKLPHRKVAADEHTRQWRDRKPVKKKRLKKRTPQR